MSDGIRAADGKATIDLDVLSNFLAAVRNLLTELTPEGHAESEAAKVVAGLIGAGNPYGFTDALKSACTSVCGDFGEPPCWQIPENDDPAHFINPCEECRAKAQPDSSLTLSGLQSEMKKWSERADLAKNQSARAFAVQGCLETAAKARRAGFDVRNPLSGEAAQ